MHFPESCRVQYHVYVTSDQANKTFVLTSPRLTGNLEGVILESYVEGRVEDVIEHLNHEAGVSDFRTMTGEEVECFIRGFHKHSLLNPEDYDADIGFRH